MILYEVVEDLGDGDVSISRFKTLDAAEKYMDDNKEWCHYESNPQYFDTDDYLHGDDSE